MSDLWQDYDPRAEWEHSAARAAEAVAQRRAALAASLERLAKVEAEWDRRPWDMWQALRQAESEVFERRLALEMGEAWLSRARAAMDSLAREDR